MMRFTNWLVLGLMMWACTSPEKKETATFQLKEGDFLFQSMTCGPLCEAIEKVTEGYNENDFSHMGMLINQGDSFVVLEAVGKSVQLTSLDQFLKRSVDEYGNPKIVVGRFKDDYRELIPKAIQESRQLLGIPYDDFYLMDNESLYCSELMYVIFKEAAGGEEIFSLQPMTFKDPETLEIFPVWKTYYDELGIEVPEGKPGLNPGGISLSNKLDILHTYSEELPIN